MFKVGKLFAMGLGALGLTGAVAQAAYPERPITIVVPYTPGGTVDLLARALGREMTKSWGAQIVIDNRPGAGGSAGAEIVAKAKPDGYTLLLSTNSPLTTNAALYPKLGYDPLKDFAPIVIAGENSMLLVAAKSFQPSTVAELIALAKQKPGALSVGTSGNGATTHLSLAAFNKLAGVDMVHVPYKGGVPSLTGALSGEVQVTFSDIVPAMPLVRDGRLKALGSTGARRAGVSPNIPTLAETGLAGFNIVASVPFVAPKGTPADVVATLNKETNRILNDPAFRQEIISLGIDPIGGTSAEADAFLQSEFPKWKQIVVDANVKIE